MDPRACLLRMLRACEDSDRSEALDALDDLREWIGRGGFLPTVAVSELGSVAMVKVAQ